MKNKRIFKTFSALCAALVLMMGLSVTAFAQGTEQPPAEDATNDANVVVEETEDSPALTPDGNAALVDDFGGNKQLITITTKGNNKVFEQIVKQLHKLIPVLSVVESDTLLQKEMVLIKLPIKQPLADIKALCESYNGLIADATQKHIIITATDEPARIDSFLSALEQYKPKEIIRSGVVAIER